MGIAIMAQEAHATRYPMRTLLILTCDGAHGFFTPPPATIPGDNFVEQHKAAMAMGWKETFDERGARIWLCPECSGK